jgi:hypothetical protein
MKKFQIRLTDKHGCGSFLYFRARRDSIPGGACQTANEYLEKRRDQDRMMRGVFMYTPYKPYSTVSVCEYDSEKQKAVRGGLKFKLRLSYLTRVLTTGEKLRAEWYEVVENTLTNIKE